MGVGQLIRNVITAETDPTVASFTKSLTSNNTILTAVNAASGTISASVLPSYVDDVLNFATLAGFPAVGETGKIYVTEDNNKTYRWTGTVYVEISSAANADQATKLSTPRTISTTGDATYSVSFDGSANVSNAITLANTGVAAGTYNALSTQIRPFTVDAKGRITGVGTPVNITPPWSAITGTPTTLSGYGITDALPLSGGTVTGVTTFSNATSSTSTTTGAVVVSGGVGVRGNQYVGGFTSLGGTAGGHPAIKLIRFSGTTGASQGSVTNIAHNLTLSKIIGVLVFLKIDSGYFIPPGFTEVAGYLYTWSIYLLNFNLRLSGSSSASILSKEFEVCITYME
ncbi:head decoration protein [Planktothrix phage PaV-LD]|uniref:head decoration protein n=1 Tax=Planktothrix phage PaV-LD TaxID=994601 RepID=UPI000243C8B1|nr:head decoration protein [Planktothrix phage PaV-LD]ADZ31551.1 hypothetical protein PaVLD_ORF044L [Planktothrix phage PaV-LD]